MKGEQSASATLLEPASDTRAAKPEEPKEKEAPKAIAPETSERQQDAAEIPGLIQENAKQAPVAEIVATAEEAPQAIAPQTSESQQEAKASACVGEDTSKQTLAAEVPQVAAPETAESQQNAEASACMGEDGSKHTPAAEPVSVEDEVPQVVAPETAESQQAAEESPCPGLDITEQTILPDLADGTTPDEAGVPKESVEAAGLAVLANSDDSLNRCVGEEAQTEIAAKE